MLGLCIDKLIDNSKDYFSRIFRKNSLKLIFMFIILILTKIVKNRTDHNITIISLFYNFTCLSYTMFVCLYNVTFQRTRFGKPK